MMRPRMFGALAAALFVAASSVALVLPAQSASAEVPLNKTIKPDIVLADGDTWTKVSKDINVFDPVYKHTPQECRTAPYSQTCDVYRIKLKRNPAPGALNFVFFSVDFTPVASTPDLSAVAVGYPSIPVGDIDVDVYDAEDHYLGQNYPGGGGDVGFILDTIATTPLKPLSDLMRPLLLGDESGDPDDFPPGGASLNIPERGGFTAKRDTYDIVISAAYGANTGYTLHIGFSDEKFTTPFEVLDPEVSGNSGFGSDIEDKSDAPTSSPPLFNLVLPEADVAPDRDIAGVGLGATGRFDAPPTISVSGARSVAATPKPPSGIALLLGLVATPLVGMGAVIVVMRRRRQALI